MQSSPCGRRAATSAGKLLAWALLLSLEATLAWGQAPQNPLKPPDRSSPRATLKTFLDSTDEIATYLAKEYAPDPSSAKFRHLVELTVVPVDSLDLSALAPAARVKGSRAAALSLYEVLSRIKLPPFDQIPDASQLAPVLGGAAPRWVIPDTEIALVRVQSGPRTGEYLFSADTVERAEEFYERVRATCPIRDPCPWRVPKSSSSTAGVGCFRTGGSRRCPRGCRSRSPSRRIWKWIGFAIVLVLYVLFVALASRVAELGRDRNRFLNALAELALPASILVGTPVVAYLALVQLNLIGEVGVVTGVTATVIMFLAGAWLAWRFAPVVAEAIISSPKIGPESIDAHLIRVSARLLALCGSATLLALGADQLGVPVYGIVAGLGVGGLAMALAAQPTIENLIGGLNLFADRPIRVGDVCKYGTDVGTVESIGIRSTRIRGPDRTLTTIPNAALARMPIVNLTQRDRILIQTVLGLRYETTPEQLRYVLVKLRELLVGHPRVDHTSVRARFVGFGSSSLDVEVFAYVTTRDWAEFLGIREDILMRMMEVVEEAGAAFAFPSQTLYLGRDQVPDDGRAHAAEAAVRAWRDEGSLPFPNFSADQAQKLRGSVAFPPPGSPTARNDRPE